MDFKPKKLFTQKEYINGCYTQYGTRPINMMEIKYKAKLPNGMWYVGGILPEDGISIDVYEDEALTKLIFMEHGITTNVEDDIEGWKFLTFLAINRIKEMGI